MVTDPKARAKLVELGYDPDLSSPVVETPQPVINPTPAVLQKEGPTAIGAGVRSFLRDSPATVAGLAAFPYGASVGGSIGSIFPGPGTAIGAGIGGIVTSVGAGLLTRYVQNKAIDTLAPAAMAQAYRQSEQEDAAQQTVASAIGGVSSGLLGLKPDLKSVVGAGRAIRDLMTKPATGLQRVAAADLGNLANVGAGAALPVGIEYGQEAYNQGTLAPDLDAKRMLINAVGGAIINNPNKLLGQKLGMSPNTYRTPYATEGLPQAHANSTPLETLPPTEADLQYKAEYEAQPYIQEQRRLVESIAQKKKFAEEFKALKAAEFEAQKQLDAEMSVNKMDAQRAADNLARENTQATEQNLSAVRQNDFIPAKVEELAATPLAVKPQPEARPKPTATTELGKEIYPDYTGNQEIDAELNARTPLSEGESIQDDFDRGIRRQEESQLREVPIVYKSYFDAGNGKKLHIWDLLEDVKDEKGGVIHPKGSTVSEPTLQRLGIKYEIPADKKQEATSNKVGPTEASAAAMDELAKQRGVKLTRPNEVIDPDTGKSISGITDLNTREAQASRTRQGLDTEGHEIQHNLVRDIETKGNAAEKSALNGFKKAVSESEEFRASGSKDVEEFLTTKTGEDFVRRAFQTDGKGDFRNYISDVVSSIKTTAGKGSVDDYARIFSRKLAYDPPHAETFGVGDVKANTSGADVKRQDGARVGDDVEYQYNIYDEKGNSIESDSIIFRDERDSFDVLTTANENAVSWAKSQKAQLPNGYEVYIRDRDGNEPKAVKKQEASSADSSRQSSVKRRFYSDDITKVRAQNTPESTKLADTSESFFEKHQEFTGKLTTPTLRSIQEANPFKGAAERWNRDSDVNQRVVQNMFDIADGKKASKLGAAEQRVKAAVQAALKQTFDERSSRPNLHQGESNPEYLPQMPNRATIKRFKNPAEHKKLLQEMTAYYKEKGRTAKDAADDFNEFVAGYNKKDVNRASQFGPLDKAHGLGIPSNWRETNLMSIMSRYMDRTTRRLAYHDSFEKAGIDDKFLAGQTVNENAAAIMRNIEGSYEQNEQFINSVAGLIKSGMLGPVTGSVDLVNSHTLGMQHHQNPAQTVKAWIASWKNIKEGWKESFATGRNRENFNALEWNEANDVTQNLRRLRDVVGDVGGRNILEKITRARVMSEGRYLATDYLGKSGKQASKFFNDFGKDTGWKTGKLSNEEISKIAARYVDSVQGTYDPRGTDFRIREGQLAPYLSLSRWSIEKLGNFDKHVVQEAAKGNWTPLLQSTLGMFVGGSAVNYVRELMTSRKNKTADWKEIATAQKDGANVVPDVVYKLAGLASASAFAGMGSDMLKSLMDTAYAKTKGQTPNNVIIEFAENTATTMVSAFKAAAEDGITPELFVDIVGKAAEDNIQAWRVAMAHLSSDKKEDIERANKMRDLRTYNLLVDNPVSDLSADFVTPMGKGDAKEFKKTQNIEEAAALLPGLIEDAIKKAGDDPERLRKELTALKQNSYQIFPNPDTMPLATLRYYTYLQKSQGSEEAAKRLQDYLERNAINKAKSSMVP